MNNNETLVLKEIFARPTYKFHIRELAKLAKLNPNTIINIADNLVKESILIKEKKKHITEIYFNFNNQDSIILKKLFNLNQIYQSGIIKILKEQYNPEAIVLMGSYSRGEDIENSDIDLVIISKKKELINLKEYEEFLNHKIHLLTPTYKEMSDEFYINFINGIVLYGAITKK